MGEFIVRGKGALDLIQSLSSNDVTKLFPGKVQYSCLLNNEAGIVDDMLVYLLPDGAYMLVVNASNIDKDWTWINQHKTEDVELINISDKTALLAVQGPLATDILQPLTDMDLGSMSYYTCQKGRFAGEDNVLISTTGYTGSGGYEVYFENEQGENIWNAVMHSGQEYGMQCAGLGARDTLRLEKGFCLYGNDIDDTTNPLEAGLGWITKFDCDFNAKAVLLSKKEAGINRKLAGFVLQEKGIARHGYPIVNEKGEEIGIVTSGTMSPCLQKAVGLGYVPKSHAKKGSEIFIQIRKKTVKAEVVRLPFV